MDASLAVASLALLGTVVTAWFTYRAATRATDVNKQATDLAWVKELRGQVEAGQTEVIKLQTQVHDLRRQLELATREAEHLVDEMRLMRRTAWRDGMTIERFRQFIGPEPPPVNANGLL